MTSRNTTPLFSLASDEDEAPASSTPASDVAYRLAFGAIGWPWLLFSLWGGRKAEKRRLLERVGLREDALPNLGSWKADTGFLHRIVDAVEELRPANVVELGAGATSLICAKAMERNGGGTLHSYDQHPGFVEATREWLGEEGAEARMAHAPLTASVPGWPGRWYDLSNLPESIDLLIIDGPPWSVHPFVRGAADCLFDRLSSGAIVLLDDGARPGERIVARRWRERWPQITFERVSGSTKGTLVGRKRRSGEVIAFPQKPAPPRAGDWRRAAMLAMAFAGGWVVHAAADPSEPASASSFIEEADASYDASQARLRMASQIESQNLDRGEIAAATGIDLPALPAGWTVRDVQVYPSDLGPAVAMVMQTPQGESVSLFATRAETPAEKLPLVESREGRSLAYWESGPFAYALTGEVASARILSLASGLAPAD
ncbi:class I SAM-dependent methyltransferase [Aurantiacibacter zhengii]|uniref:Class I SAM-dependent methyltransferase n=1 Tax=Aurantiacibacter zhengii TaxID=2307003 RepID=A0A418NTW7_9SPHN|nr:class I SAM-dependent methyltransferase [Aurantiacibacter zhengii]RIV87592.1 class I SAM-dependent methyltransferase [Aurantiacibacter zhengii]